VRDDGSTEVWAKPMSDGSVAVILLNRGRGPVPIGVSAREIGLKAAGSYTVRDLWRHTQASSQGRIEATVPTHAVAMFRVWPGPHGADAGAQR
jgi:alpha-galactosidase